MFDDQHPYKSLFHNQSTRPIHSLFTNQPSFVNSLPTVLTLKASTKIGISGQYFGDDIPPLDLTYGTSNLDP